MRILAAVLIFSAVFVAPPGTPAPAWAQTSSSESVAEALAKARVLYDRNRFEEALTIFRSLADDGNAQAMYHLARANEFQYDAERDAAIWLEWYLKSARGGFEPAQMRLGEWIFYRRIQFLRIASNMAKTFEHEISRNDPEFFHDFGKAVDVAGERDNQHQIQSDQIKASTMFLLAQDGYAKSGEPLLALILKLKIFLRSFTQDERDFAIARELANEWLEGDFQVWTRNAIQNE